MDSTLISTRPDEGTLSLSRARRAALGSFAGAVVDWYDFLLYGITAALVFNREFFPQVSPAMGTLAAVSYTHLTLPTTIGWCRSRWSPYH